MTPCIWLGTTHPCNPPQYGLEVNLHFFTICMYKHCFLPMLLVFVIKCCIKMPCSLPHNHYCCSLPPPACLPHLLICTCLNSSPLLAQLHLCYVDVDIFFNFLSVLKFHSFVLFLSLTFNLVNSMPNLLCQWFSFSLMLCL